MVYVDNMKAAFGRMRLCHMLADTTVELLAMADQIGVDRRWLQHPGTHKEHFDISLTKRVLALQAGAQEITWKEAAVMIAQRRQGWCREQFRIGLPGRKRRDGDD